MEDDWTTENPTGLDIQFTGSVILVEIHDDDTGENEQYLLVFDGYVDLNRTWQIASASGLRVPATSDQPFFERVAITTFPPAPEPGHFGYMTLSSVAMTVLGVTARVAVNVLIKVIRSTSQEGRIPDPSSQDRSAADIARWAVLIARPHLSRRGLIVVGSSSARVEGALRKNETTIFHSSEEEFTVTIRRLDVGHRIVDFGSRLLDP